MVTVTVALNEKNSTLITSPTKTSSVSSFKSLLIVYRPVFVTTIIASFSDASAEKLGSPSLLVAVKVWTDLHKYDIIIL